MTTKGMMVLLSFGVFRTRLDVFLEATFSPKRANGISTVSLVKFKRLRQGQATSSHLLMFNPYTIWPAFRNQDTRLFRTMPFKPVKLINSALNSYFYFPWA